MKNKNYIIVISGATATGKSSFAINLAQKLYGEIINADIGSFYKPMTIGTAKPDWQNEQVPHHMFDIIDTPVSLTIFQFRSRVQELCQNIWNRGKVPIIVGGSAFYIQALFYKQQDIEGTQKFIDELEAQNNVATEILWKELEEIDDKRAQCIDPNDRYRIIRALAIFKSTGKKPSEFIQNYDPVAPFYFVICDRDRQELYGRIDIRVEQMLAEGWIDEVKNMQNTLWQDFIYHKKMIGYDDVLMYITGKELAYENMVARIQKRTRNYAKRQVTFLKKLKQNVKQEILKHGADGVIESVDLTLCDVGLYIDQLLLRILK